MQLRGTIILFSNIATQQVFAHTIPFFSTNVCVPQTNVESGGWLDIPAQLAISLPQTWHEFPWIQIGGGLLILVLILEIIRLRTNFLSKQKRRLEKEVRKRTQQIERQKSEIEEKNRILENKNHEAEQRNQQIINQNQLLRERNEEIKTQQEKIQEKSRLLEETHQNLVNAHEELKMANNNLESKVDQRTRELQEAMQKLIKTDEELNIFLYRSSHDLRGPIVSLLSLSQLIYQENNQPHLTPYLEKFFNSCQRMLRFLTKLNDTNLVFKTELKPSPVNFKKMYHEIVEEISSLDQANKVRKIFTNLVEREIYLDNSLVQVIIQNLLENAIIFQNNVKPYFQLTIIEKDNQLIIEVRDNGLGIDEKIQDKIFTMFYRGSEHSLGNGLGLYMVHKAVSLMNGSIKISSTKNQGTLFRVLVPLEREKNKNTPLPMNNFQESYF